MGNSQTAFQFSCKQNTPYGIYFLSLDKSGDGNSYTSLPILEINVTSIPVVFQFDVTVFSIPIGSSNFIIYEKVPVEMPNDYITLMFSLAPEEILKSGLTLNQNNIKLDKINKFGFISISSSFNESFVGVSVNLQVSLIGPNANSYVLSTESFVLNIIANRSYSLNASLTANSYPQNVLNSTFTMSCSNSGIGFYQLSKESCPFEGIDSVISFAKSFYSFTASELCQKQFGIVYFESDGLIKTVSISNLRANKKYAIFGFCQDFAGNYSSMVYANFTGKDNGGLLMKMRFIFQSNLTQMNKERVSCFLTGLLGIPYQK